MWERRALQGTCEVVWTVLVFISDEDQHGTGRAAAIVSVARVTADGLVGAGGEVADAR